MLNKKVLFTFLVLLNLSFVESGFSQSNQFFSFNLQDSATTSSGVFKNDGTLIRTLWSGVRYAAGTYTEAWDGLLDDGSTAPSDDYHVEVLSNNVKYDWDGARIGNTSTAFTGSTIHRAGDAPLCMAIVNSYLYYGCGYQERFNTTFRTKIGNTGVRERLGTRYFDLATQQLCSDGNILYIAGYNQGAPAGNCIYGLKVSDNSEVIFPAGEYYQTYGSYIQSALSISTITSNVYLNDVQSMAVQSTSDKLFISRFDKLQVLNKTTGQLLQTITSMPGRITIAVDQDDLLWVANGSTITKYIVNPDGTLTSTGITISGILDAAAIAVSPDNKTVVIADDDITQQLVKGFNNHTGGEAIWTIGTQDGYMKDATVNNNKFYFKDIRTNYPTAISFENDGSFWVVDGGNTRIQHYSPTNTYIDRIMYMPVNYVVQADPNNLNRVFGMWGGGATSNGGYLEFNVDYTQPLDNGNNGSWELVKNWGGNISNDYEYFTKMQNIVTIAGHTFGCMRSKFGGIYHIFELVEGGVARKTKVTFTVRQTIAKNGDKLSNPEGSWIGHESNFYRDVFTGLDNDNDPTWSSTSTVFATIPTLTFPNLMPDEPFRENITSSGKLIIYNPTFYKTSTGNEAHLGAINLNDKRFLWQTSYGTLRSYNGDFPIGYFDNGNGVGGPGGDAGGYSTVDGRSIIWTYHGEFWKTSQTNKFNHYWDNGLFIGQFGTLRTDYGDQESVYGGAGNALYGTLSQYTDDVSYLYSGDEGVNAGVQRWKLSGMKTIMTQTCEFSTSFKKTSISGIDLMAGLEGKDFLVNDKGWSISKEGSQYNDDGKFWYVPVGSKTPAIRGNQDVYALYNQPTEIMWVTRDLGSNSGLRSWKLNGKINFDRNIAANSIRNSGEGAYLEILDDKGKTISRLFEYTTNFEDADMKGNDKVIHHFDIEERRITTSKNQKFEIIATNNKLTFIYGAYTVTTSTLVDPEANIENPTTLRLFFTPGANTKAIGVSSLMFENTNTKYRSKTSGDWNEVTTWESSVDSVTWVDAKVVPSSYDNAITIQDNHKVTISTSATVDQLYISNTGILEVAPKAEVIINDGPGDDIIVAAPGNMIIKSDSLGSGQIGASLGTISGEVTVESYINSFTNQAYRLITPSVNTINTSKPFIRDNWQEGQNNTTLSPVNNSRAFYGIDVTGSDSGTDGFDITKSGLPSVFNFDQRSLTPDYIHIVNTDSTNLVAKTGYMVYIEGDRSSDLQSNTTLRVTGNVETGTQTFTAQEADSRFSLVTNPYVCPINWKSIYKDASTSNAQNFSKFYTYWEPLLGTKGGYVTVGANGIKSAATRATTIIKSGQAFFIQALPGVVSPTFTVKESHKSNTSNQDTIATVPAEMFMSSLYYSDSKRIMADAVNTVFDNAYSTAIDENDAEEMANWDENIAITRAGKMLSIETRPLFGLSDTLSLSIQRLKVQNYEWQFNASGFDNSKFQSYLEDKFLNSRTLIGLTGVTVVPFSVTADTASANRDRFRIVFVPIQASATPVYRINAGGNQVTTSKGVFFADAYFTTSPGDTYSDTTNISGTPDAEIYKSERSGSTGTFGYAFPVINGTYTVVLHFAEIYYARTGNRVFDVSSEGVNLLHNYDIFKKAGAFAATTESFEVNVTDGMLNLDFSSLASDGGKDRAKISAIEILSNSGNKAPVASAGNDITISLPANSATLNGSAVDSDGTIGSYNWVQMSGPNHAILSSDTVASPIVRGLIAGTYVFSVVARDNELFPSAPDEVIISVNAGSSTGTAVYRINAGGGEVATSKGVFSADNYFWPIAGDTFSEAKPIAGTTDEAIYQSERSGSTGTFGYAFPVSNGQYTVILHFAEIYYGKAGNRIFDVSAESTKVLDDFDIFRKAGAFTATTESFGVTVTDGILNIDFSSLAIDGGLDRAKVSAIEVISNSAAAPVVSSETGIKASTSREEAHLQKLSATVQPNPSAGLFNIRIAGNNKPVSIKIFDVSGQLIETKTNVAAGSSLSLGSNYRAGLYYAVINQDAEKLIVRFIKLTR